MEWEKIGTNWERMQVVAHERWRRLSSSDLELIDGDREELVVMLVQRYKWDSERAEKEVQAWQQSDQHAPSLTRPNSLRRVS
jgi:hypothetical protein